jgi:hypothetical protein
MFRLRGIDTEGVTPPRNVNLNVPRGRRLGARQASLIAATDIPFIQKAYQSCFVR